MFCAISGEAPKEPVVSRKSGLVYEKRLIETYISENGKDPVTNEELATDDLIAIKTSSRTAFPRPPTHSSVPSLLAALQNEYDAVMLEMLTLKQQYDGVRQELAHALYTNDASMRVIARLMKERDEAREGLASVHTTLGAPQTDVDMAPAEPQSSVPLATAASIDALAGSLSSERRARIKRGAPAGYTTGQSAAQLAVASTVPSPHNASAPELTSFALSANGALAVTGGADKHVVVYDLAHASVMATLDGHTKPVTCVALSGASNPTAGEAPADAPRYIVSGSEDQTVRVWRAGDNSYALAHTIELDAPVAAVAVHPTDEIIGVAMRNGMWALYMLATGESLLQVPAPEHGAAFSYESLAFHPDGQLVATGTADGVVRVWDVKHGQQSAAFAGHDGAVHALDFSQNGYLLAAASRSATEAKIWDLRKLEVSRSVSAPEHVQSVRFDATAQLLAVTGTETHVYTGKALAHAASVPVEDGAAIGAAWSAADGTLVVAAKRALQIVRANVE